MNEEGQIDKVLVYISQENNDKHQVKDLCTILWINVQVKSFEKIILRFRTSNLYLETQRYLANKKIYCTEILHGISNYYVILYSLWGLRLLQKVPFIPSNY